MKTTHAASRGQALAETTIFLPTFIFILFAVIWSVQTAIANERLQVAVRYSGLISSLMNPYMQYSLFVVYNNVNGTIGVAPQPCFTPSTDALSNSGTYPGPASGTFYQPTNVAPTCAPAQTSFQDGTLRPEIMRSNITAITANSTVPQLLQNVYHWSSGVTQLGAQQNFLEAPDLGTVMQCYPALNSTVSASLNPPPAANPQLTAALPATLPTTPLAPSQSCAPH